MRDTYHGALKPMCVQAQVSFEDRDCLRKEEIEALQDAHSLLDQPSNSSDTELPGRIMHRSILFLVSLGYEIKF